MASKFLMLLVGLLVIGGVIAARVICSVYNVRRQDNEDVSRWENEGGAVPGERDWLPY